MPLDSTPSFSRKGQGLGFAVREEPGCEDFTLFRSEDDPDRSVLIELWTAQADLDAHLQLMRARPLFTPPSLWGKAPWSEKYELEQWKPSA